MSRLKKNSKSENFIDKLNYDLFMVGEFKIDLIKDYLINIDKYLIDKTVEIEEKITEWQNSDKEEEYSGIDYYIVDYRNYRSEFKKIKLESIFLSSYSLFEHYLKSFCKDYSEYFELKILVEDLGGNNYINKSKRYLEKVIELNLEKLNPIWKEITNYQRIRNKIVHNNSKFNSSEKEIIIELSKINGIEINSEGWILLNDKEFIFHFFKLFDKYVTGIIEITNKKINIEK